MYWTYGIVDPTTRLFVYVGQTNNFDARSRQHLTTHRKKGPFKKGSREAWLKQAHKAGITPQIVILEVVETDALSIDSENNWVEKLSSIGHPLLNRWEEHKELIEAGRAPPAERETAYLPGQWKSGVGEMEPTAKRRGHKLTFSEGVEFKAGDQLIILPPKEK